MPVAPVEYPVAAVVVRAEPAAVPLLAFGEFQNLPAVCHRWPQWPFVAGRKARAALAGQLLPPRCDLRLLQEV